HIGQVAAAQLAVAVQSLPQLLSHTPESLAALLQNIAGFGPKMSESVQAFVFGPTSRALLEKLQQHGVSTPEPRPESAGRGPLVGLSFCVTGVLSKKRDDVHAAIRAAGGEVHDKVKQGTDYLVAGQKVGKSKLD